jgi:PAS domain S-box-containing protein
MNPLSDQNMPNKIDKTQQRRARAEVIFKNRPIEAGEFSTEDIQALVHELQVHQIELEMQNDEMYRAHAELASAMDSYTELYDFAPVGYCSIDASGLISRANLTFAAKLDYERSGLIHQPFSRFVLPADQDRYYLYIKRLTATQITDICEIRLVNHVGSQIDVQLTGKSLRDKYDQANGCQIALTDISALKKQAVELRKLAAAVEQSSSSIVLTDLQGSIEYVNPTFLRVTGYSAVEIIGKNPRILQSGQTPKHVYKQMWASITAGGEWHGEFYNRKKSGELYWESVSMSAIKDTGGQVTHFLAVKDDITRRKETEKQLQDAHSLLEHRVTERTAELTASKQQVEAIVNNNPAGIVLLSPDCHVLTTNPTFNMLFLSQPDEYLHQSVFELFDKDDRQQVQEAIQSGTAKKLALPIVVRTQRCDGTVFDSEMSIGYIPDGNLVCTINDITIRKQAESHMEQALAREKELNELKSKFVSMASHEFRTPLATILASSETLAAYRHKMTEAQIEQKFVKIKEQVDHLKGIMDDVLYLARMDARRVEFSPSILDIDALIRTVIDEFQSRPDFEYQIDYHFEGSSAPVMLDNKLMRQILGNLFSNAVKYSLPDKVIIANLKITTNAIAISVADQGIGIPESDRPRLFESFHRGSNVGTISGTGLGLLITKESVELHGGLITVASEVGIGTTFTVTIPMTIG